MSKRSIPILVFLMISSLIGIIYIQYKWITYTVNEKEELIDNNVMTAVANVEQRLNDLQTITLIQDSLMGDYVMDTLLKSVDEKHNKIKLFTNKKTTSNWNFSQLQTTVQQENFENISITIAEDSSTVFKSFEGPFIQDSVAQLLSSIIVRLNAEMEEPTTTRETRLDSAKVERLLTDELKTMQLGPLKNWGIYDVKNQNYLVSPRLQEKTAYSIALFSTDLVSPRRYQLELTIAKDELIWENIWIMIGLSLLFILIIFIVFIRSIQLIVKHKKISAIKSDFINNMTHEFKTPLASISLAADSLMHPNLSLTKQNVDTYTTIIKTEKTKLNKYVERILEVAALSKDKVEIKVKTIGVNEIINQTLSDLKLLIQERDASISLNLFEQDKVKANALHLQQVFTNLVENSIKYAAKTPAITLTSFLENKQLIVQVKDNGIGMTTHQINRAFDQFYRVHSGNLHTTKGFGLGLNYCKMVIEKMGGTIALTSIPNEGTTVTVKLHAV